LTYLEDLAADPKFVGRVLIGVEPDLFFSGFEYRGGAVRYTRKESPSQYVGQQLSMRLIEPYLATHAEQRRISRLREPPVSARKDLDRVARRHRRTGRAFRGLP
jgi:hypothetical protein